MTEQTSWTRHTPAPSILDDDPTREVGGITLIKCAYCTQWVRPVRRFGTGVRKGELVWLHVKEEPTNGWDARTAKDLYESLDVVFNELDENTKADMMTALGTICGWSQEPDMWNTIRRWTSDKAEG